MFSSFTEKKKQQKTFNDEFSGSKTRLSVRVTISPPQPTFLSIRYVTPRRKKCGPRTGRGRLTGMTRRRTRNMISTSLNKSQPTLNAALPGNVRTGMRRALDTRDPRRRYHRRPAVIAPTTGIPPCNANLSLKLPSHRPIPRWSHSHRPNPP